MFFFLPIGVEDHTVDRLPWVSISIAGLSLLAFLFTWVVPGSGRPEEVPLSKIVTYWDAHPYLVAPANLTQAGLTAKVIPANRGIVQRSPTPAASVVADEQEELETLVASYVEASEKNPLRRFGLVPARGLHQPGWITHMFLHAGWMHLLGNFLFFYLVGPLLEDVWGRPLFASFYLVGGLLSGAGWASANPHSEIYLVGASGAIAACMGAFTYRFAQRRIIMGYLVWFLRIFRGTFRVPAWIWGLSWFAMQLFDYKLGGQSNVAFAAHLAGFGFGFAVALVLGITRFEADVLAPSVARKVGWSQDPAVERANAALAHDDLDGAEQAFQRVLAEKPGDFEASLGLAQLAVRRGDRQAIAGQTAKALSAVLAHSPGRAWEIVEALGAALQAEQLPPALAFRLAVAMQSAPEGLRAHREPLFVAAAAAGGALGAKALLQAAQLGLERQAEPTVVRGYLSRARSLEGLSPDLMARIDALEGALPPALDLSLPEEASTAALPPELRRCRLVAIQSESLDLATDQGATASLPLRAIQAVAVGVVNASAVSGVPVGERVRKVLIIDLVTAWADSAKGAQGHRLTSETLSPQRFYPALTPAQGYASVLSAILHGSGATLLPDADAIRRGTYPSFSDLAAFDAAIYRDA